MKKVDIRKFRSDCIFLEIGNLRSIPCEGIVGIFDLDTATNAKITADFLKKKQAEGGITTASAALPKSFILYDDGEWEQIYFSPFSASVLRQRMESGSVIQVHM